MLKPVTHALLFFSVACLADPAPLPGSQDGSAVGSDASEPCPGEAIFEGEIQDFASGQRIEQTITLRNLSSNQEAQAAPNGRVRLCNPSSSGSILEVSTEGYLPRRHTLDPALSVANFQKGLATTLELATLRDLEEALADVGIAFNASRSYVRVDVINSATGQGVSGATLTTQSVSAGGFVRAGGQFEPSTVTDSQGSLWLLNVDGGPISIRAIQGRCDQEVSAADAPGGIASLQIGC